MTSERPIKKFKVGGVQVAVWENRMVNPDGNEETLRNVTMERSYRNRQGEWKNSSSLRMADVPKAILAMSKAYEFMALEEPEMGNGDEGD